jgi:hypothetical protein
MPAEAEGVAFTAVLVLQPDDIVMGSLFFLMKHDATFLSSSSDDVEKCFAFPDGNLASQMTQQVSVDFVPHCFLLPSPFFVQHRLQALLIVQNCGNLVSTPSLDQTVPVWHCKVL